MQATEAPDRPHLSSSATSSQPREGDGPTVLLAEDQEAVRQLTRTVLERAGYHVIAAPDAAAARAAAKAYGIDRIDALVTDVVMPGESGPELASALRAARPSMPVLFMSGYAEGMLLFEAGTAPGEAFLAKPFTPATLVDRVRGLLAAGPDRSRHAVKRPRQPR